MAHHQLLRKLKGSMIMSSDDVSVGEIVDYYFDDENWVVRYFVVNTGSWLNERQVLISPYAVTDVEWGGFNVRVNLTGEQIRNGPTPEENRPVSRLYEEKYALYYQIPFYWLSGDGLWPTSIDPNLYEHRESEELNEEIHKNHLRSYQEILRYRIHAKDDIFGHVEDFVMSEDSFAIEYLVIDTRNFLPSPSVLIPVEWIVSIDWEESELRIDLPKDQIIHAEKLNRSRPIDLSL